MKTFPGENKKEESQAKLNSTPKGVYEKVSDLLQEIKNSAARLEEILTT